MARKGQVPNWSYGTNSGSSDNMAFDFDCHFDWGWKCGGLRVVAGTNPQQPNPQPQPKPASTASPVIADPSAGRPH